MVEIGQDFEFLKGFLEKGFKKVGIYEGLCVFRGENLEFERKDEKVE